MPPAAISSSVFVTMARASSPSRRSRNSSTGAFGNFGARPQPPNAGSKLARRPRTASASSGVGQGLLGRAERRRAADRLDELRRRRRDLVAPVAPGRRDRVQHLREARQAVPRLGRVVRAAVEGLAVGRQEDRHRPAALPGERDHRLHVDRVEVGPLLAVDLDADEVLVHRRRDRVVLERLVLHHVAPVAGGVADREQDRLVLVAGARQRLVAPRVPVDGVAGVLEQVGAGLVGESVHTPSLPVARNTRSHARSSERHRHLRLQRRRGLDRAPQAARRPLRRGPHRRTAG